MENAADSIDGEIGARVKALRLGRSQTIDDLAEASGVSRAMISKVERGEASATAQLLSRLCGALGVTLSALFARREDPLSPLARRGDQRVWHDPATGYARRSIAPPASEGVVELAEILLPPGASVPFDRLPGIAGDQLVWVLDGVLDLVLGDALAGPGQRLHSGDCMAMRQEEPKIFRNGGDAPARYAVFVANRRGHGMAAPARGEGR